MVFQTKFTILIFLAECRVAYSPESVWRGTFPFHGYIKTIDSENSPPSIIGWGNSPLGLSSRFPHSSPRSIPLFTSRPLNKRGQTKQNQFNCWQDHLCGLTLGRMPDWARVLGLQSFSECCQIFSKCCHYFSKLWQITSTSLCSDSTTPEVIEDEWKTVDTRRDNSSSTGNRVRTTRRSDTNCHPDDTRPWRMMLWDRRHHPRMRWVWSKRKTKHLFVSSNGRL